MLDPLIKLKQDIELHFLKLKNINFKLAELKDLQEKCMSDKAAINAILNAMSRDTSELRFTSVESVSNKNDSNTQLSETFEEKLCKNCFGQLVIDELLDQRCARVPVRKAFQPEVVDRH